jgi:hypothetical protein
MAKIKFNNQKVMLQNDYTKLEDSTIILQEMAAKETLKLKLKRVDYKVVRVPKINEFGEIIKNEFCNKISTTLYMHDKQIINSLSTSISRFVFMLLKSMDIEVEEQGYIKLNDLDIDITINKINKNNKNSYKVALKKINKDEADIEKLAVKDIKSLLQFNNILDSYDDERLAIEGESLPIA